MQDQYDAYLQLNYALKHIWAQVVIFFEPAKHFTKIDALASLTADDTLDTETSSRLEPETVQPVIQNAMDIFTSSGIAQAAHAPDVQEGSGTEEMDRE